MVDGSRFENIRFDGNITGTAMFRLLISDYLPEYEKCLYFDCDIVVLGDISELYELPIGENYIAAIKDGGVQCYFEKFSGHAKEIDIKSMRSYVNSGILVMNLKMLRKRGMKDVFLSHISKQYQFPDQDILNTCCEGKIHYLPLKYNIFRRFYHRLNWLHNTDFSAWERAEAEESPVILHYAEGLKPWIICGEMRVISGGSMLSNHFQKKCTIPAEKVQNNVWLYMIGKRSLEKQHHVKMW